MKSHIPRVRNPRRTSVLLLASFILMVSVCSFGSETFYVSQGGGQLTCNGGLQSTQSSSFFNSSSNWGNPKVSGKIGPGDTVFLCGAFTGSTNATILTAGGSGSSGSPITIKWDSTAVLASPACSASSGCFNTSQKSWLILDGNGTTPSITSTANGTNLANRINAYGIQASSCNNCEFKNLTVTNMYVFVGPNDANENGVGISVACTRNTSVHDSNFDQMASPISDGFCDGDTADSFYNNTLDHFNHGIEIGNNGTQHVSNFQIYGNHLKNMVNWDTTNDYHHHDGIFFYQNTAVPNTVTNFYVYNNLADGDLGVNATAWVYYNSGLNGVYVFNNKFFNPGSRAVALLEGGYSGDQNNFIYNNYFDCGTNGRAVQVSSFTGFTFENNTMGGSCSVYFFGNPGITIGSGTMDNNVYAGATANNDNLFKWQGNYITFTAMQGQGLDVHSILPDSTGGDKNGVPQPGSAMIHDGKTNFANLTSSCTGKLAALCSDYAGVARPNSGTLNWDGGAYVYDSGNQPPAPPTGLAAVVN